LDGESPEVDDLVETWPPDDRWHFRTGECWFKRHCIRLDGQLFLLLQVFARARTPLGYADLMAKVWGPNNSVNEETIRGRLVHLRTALRKRFKWSRADDPVILARRKPPAWELNKDLFGHLGIACGVR
jgi:hypothetical protein